MSNALVDLVAIFSFVAHLGKKFIQVEYDSFLHLLFCKKEIIDSFHLAESK